MHIDCHLKPYKLFHVNTVFGMPYCAFKCFRRCVKFSIQLFCRRLSNTRNWVNVFRHKRPFVVGVIVRFQWVTVRKVNVLPIHPALNKILGFLWVVHIQSPFDPSVKKHPLPAEGKAGDFPRFGVEDCAVILPVMAAPYDLYGAFSRTVNPSRVNIHS